jgi:tripartite-type tricarboxylate transporter receptor subunit TctC
MNRFAKLVSCALSPRIAGVASAQAPMPKTIRIVVPFSAGGSNDVVARAIAAPLSARLGVPVIVENRAGAGRRRRLRPGREIAARRLGAARDVVELPDRRGTQRELPYDALNAFAPVGDRRTRPDARRRVVVDGVQDAGTMSWPRRARSPARSTTAAPASARSRSSRPSSSTTRRRSG